MDLGESTAGDVTVTGDLIVADDSFLGLSSSAGRIVFDDQGTDEINILSARLGVGTSAPTTALDVVGTISGSALTLSGPANNSYILGNLSIGKTGAGLAKLDVVGTISGTTLQINGAGTFLTDITVSGGDITGAGGAALDLGESTAGDVTVTGDLIVADDSFLGISSSAGRIVFDDQGTDEINILSARLGVGTSAPTTALDVVGTISGSALTLNGPANNSYILGNLSIGKTGAGLAKLDVVGTISGTTLQINGAGTFLTDITVSGGDITGAGGAALDLGESTAGDVTVTGDLIVADDSFLGISSSAGRIVFDDQGTDEINILSARLGVGTSAPTTALDVVGTISGSALTINSGSTGLSYFTGNVAIGRTASARTKLEVQGTMSGTDLIISNNIGVGTTSPVQPLHVAGHCVTGDTVLRRRRKKRKNGEGEEDEWEDVPIEDIEPGDEIQTLDEETGAFVVARVNGLLDMGTKPVFRITTESGKRIRTTGNHPYLVQGYAPHTVTAVMELGFAPVGSLVEGEGGMPGTTWVKVAGLRVGDRIGVARSFTDDVPAAAEKPYDREKSSDGGNGTNVSGKSKNALPWISFSGISRNSFSSVLSMIASSLGLMRTTMIPQQSPGGYRSPSSKSASWVTITHRSSMAMRNTAGSQEPSGARSVSCPSDRRNASILRWMFSSSRKRMCGAGHEGGVVAARLDGAGGELEGGLDVRGLERRVGVVDLFKVRAGLQHVEDEVDHDAGALEAGLPMADLRMDADIIADTHSGQQHIPATIGESTNTLAFERIVSIEYAGEEQVWDIEVEGTHNFVGNGIVAHNTYITGNLGLGKASPVTKLDVVGTISGTTLQINGAGTFLTDITVSGGDITGAGGAALDLGESTAGDVTVTGDLIVADDSFLGLSSSAGRIVFDDQATDEINILSARLGVGTSAPTAALDVVGTVSGSVLSAGIGSATAPGITFNGDSDSGLFWISANVLGVATGGAERVRIDASGNVGIGTTYTGGARLSVSGTMSGRSLSITGTGASPLLATQLVTGGVGIHTATPGALLDIESPDSTSVSDE
ncbi:MAG: cell wall surface anchor family protein, partial [Candidatus Peregrinibacteria bacterium Greene0416_19]